MVEKRSEAKLSPVGPNCTVSVATAAKISCGFTSRDPTDYPRRPLTGVPYFPLNTIHGQINHGLKREDTQMPIQSLFTAWFNA